MRTVILMGMVLSTALWSQTEKPKPAGDVFQRSVQKVVEVKNVDVRQLADVLQGSNVIVRANESFRTISLWGPAENVTEIEEIIKRLDSPRAPTRMISRNVDLVFYILVAAPKGTSGDALPPDLDGVAKQLKQIFNYNDFRLVDSSVLRTREGEGGQSNGSAMIANAPSAPMSNYEIRFGRTGVGNSERGNMIRIDNFRFNARVPNQAGGGNWTYPDIGFTTNLDIREGQKVVVGKAKFEGSDSALILVISAKVAD